jgi:hypothetical protein
LRKVWLYFPEYSDLEWNLAGPFLTVTLWFRKPTHYHVTLVPFLTVSLPGLK